MTRTAHGSAAGLASTLVTDGAKESIIIHVVQQTRDDVPPRLIRSGAGQVSPAGTPVVVAPAAPAAVTA